MGSGFGLQWRRRLGWGLAGTLLAAGCYDGDGGRAAGEGTDDAGSDDGEADDDDDDGADESGDGEAPATASGPTGLRLLTPTQHRNSVISVLGEVDFEPTGQWRSSIAAAQGGVSPALVEEYEAVAQVIAEQVFTDLDRRATLAGCTPTTAADDPCVAEVVATLGRRAWRRPLTADETSRYGALAAHTATLVEGDGWVGLQHAVAALLQSPNFLYRVEVGTPVDDGSNLVRLDGYEVASRLSYLIWNDTPDDTLLDAVAAGDFDDVETRAAQVLRLLDDPRARAGTMQVFVDMLDLDALFSLQKDVALLPAFTPTIGPAMREELVRTIGQTVIDQADLRRLFDTDTGFVNAELAALYGVEGSFDDTFVEVDLPDGRAGVLTLAGFLAINSGEASTSPTKRGLIVRNILMCQPIPPPPPDVEADLPEPGGNEPQTKRQQLAQHAEDPACATCHDFMDPIGLALENFNALGGYRTTDNGLPIDASGALDGMPFADATELGAALAEHPAVAACMVRSLYRYAVGHVEQPDESETINAMNDALKASGYDLRAAVEALALAPAFDLGLAPAEEGQ